MEWFRHGYRHRLDGPAVVHVSGRRELWVNGRRAYTVVAFEVMVAEFTATLVGHGCAPDNHCHAVPRPEPRPRTAHKWVMSAATAA